MLGRISGFSKKSFSVSNPLDVRRKNTRTNTNAVCNSFPDTAGTLLRYRLLQEIYCDILRQLLGRIKKGIHAVARLLQYHLCGFRLMCESYQPSEFTMRLGSA